MEKKIAPERLITHGRFVLAALLVLTCCVAHPASTAYAKKKKLAKYGTIKVQTTPAGLPITVDGKAEGETTTTWRAWDRDPGVHTIVITLPNGTQWTREISLDAGRIKCVALNYRPPLVALSPCPYPVNLSAPVTVNEGDVITFTSDVSYSGTSPLVYKWTVIPANAKVLSGLGTPTITVDSTSVGNQSIRATLLVEDGSGDAVCRQTALASTLVRAITQTHREAGEFDVCCNCAFDDQKARLDNLAVELQNDPSATGYILGYGGRSSRAGEADRLNVRARDYLIIKRGIDPARIIALNGGYREQDCVDLWIVPSGATPPQPRPTVQPGDVHPAPAKLTRRRGA
ncbi:MAG: PEGA domain-containing protein [bacterium]